MSSTDAGAWRAWRAVVRRRGVALLTALVFSAVVLLGVALTAPEYESSMTLLLRRVPRVPIGTSPAGLVADDGESETARNAVVGLLESREVLQRVVDESGLLVRTLPSGGGAGTDSEGSTLASTDLAMARAVRQLQDQIDVSVVPGSPLVQLRYRGRDPVRAAEVLAALARVSSDTHRTLTHPRGTFAFFQQQTRTLGQTLRDAEQRLTEFERTQGVTAPSLERDHTLQVLADTEAALQRARVQLLEAVQRLVSLRELLAATPSRQPTIVQSTSDVERIRQLTTSVTELERASADLELRLDPTHPDRQQADQQLAVTRASLAEAERPVVTLETSDQNPTHQWLRDELARASTEREGLVVRVQALGVSVDEYREKAQRLADVHEEEVGLRRAVERARDNYALAERAQESARMSEAFDQSGVDEIAIVDAPHVAAAPSNGRRLRLLLIGLVLSAAGGMAAAVALDAASPGFRNQRDVEDVLGVPVLATLPIATRVMR